MTDRPAPADRTVEFSEDEFVKSRHSNGPTGGCVRLASKQGVVAVYSDLEPFPGSDRVQRFTVEEFSTFLRSAKEGEFDDLLTSEGI